MKHFKSRRWSANAHEWTRRKRTTARALAFSRLYFRAFPARAQHARHLGTRLSGLQLITNVSFTILTNVELMSL